MNISLLIRWSVILGFLVTLPLVLMEIVNRWHQTYDFPFVLFIILWILATVTLGTLIIIFKDVRSKRYPKGIWKLVLSSTILVAAFTLWLLIVTDQMPCFEGISNCD